MNILILLNLFCCEVNKYCFKIYSIYKDIEDIIYIEAKSKEKALESLKEGYEGEISDYKYLGIE